MFLWLAYFVAFVAPVLIQGYLAWRDGFLTPAEMQAQGVSQGLPFIAHAGMWSDATVFAAVMATILISYANQWTPWQWVGALSIGLVASALMHWGIYAKGSLPEAHVRNGAVTSTGLVHFLYMAISLGILGLFYVCTKGLTPTYLFGVSLFLVLHMIIGSHLILKAWANATHPSWYPIQPVIDLTAGITIVGVAVVLSGASWWAVRQ